MSKCIQKTGSYLSEDNKLKLVQHFSNKRSFITKKVGRKMKRYATKLYVDGQTWSKTDGVIGKYKYQKQQAKLKSWSFGKTVTKTFRRHGRVYKLNHQKRRQRSKVSPCLATIEQTFVDKAIKKRRRGNNAKKTGNQVTWGWHMFERVRLKSQ